jgi:hypothetical protein
VKSLAREVFPYFTGLLHWAAFDLVISAFPVSALKSVLCEEALTHAKDDLLQNYEHYIENLETN